MWSKIETSCHYASDNSLTPCWHGDGGNNDNNGASNLRASTGQVAVLQFLSALGCGGCEG